LRCPYCLLINGEKVKPLLFGFIVALLFYFQQFCPGDITGGGIVKALIVF
jgi:hypothetical protein